MKFHDVPDYSVLYVLGDSISDSGGINGLVAPGSPGSYLARFGYGNARLNVQDSDGDGADDAASYVTEAVTRFGLAGAIENFAIAGAEALRSRTLREALSAPSIVPDGPTVLETLVQSTEPGPPPEASLDTVIDAEAQLGRILARHEEAGRPEGAAALINIGANDYDVLADRFADDLAGGITLEFLAELIPATLATITGVTQAIVDQTAAFAAAGIETVIVVDLFADYTPQVQNDPLVAPLGEIIIGLNNAALAAAVTRLDRDPTVDVDIELVRLSALFDEIFDDPSSFNILSLSEPVYLSLPFGDPAQPGAFDILRNPDLPATVGLDQLLFWDVLHLSASGQDIASAYLGAALQDDLRFLGEGDDSFVDRVAGDLSGAPDDVVFAGRGFDTVNGGLGDDVLFGGADGDWLDGGVGDDIVVGGSGDDRLSGGMRQPGSLALGGGFDVLSGCDGNDSLAGGDGADFLSDGLGADHVAGDAGRDVLVFVDAPLLGGRREAPGGDRFDGGDGFDTLLLFIEDTALRDEAVSGVRAAVDTGGLAAFSLDSLGLTVVDVERVIVFGERRLPRDLDLPARLAEAVAEADAWNGIPLSADGPFTIASDAVYDSGLGAIL